MVLESVTLAAATGLTVVGLGGWVLSFTARVRPWLHLPATLRRWVRVAFPPPGGVSVVEADPLGCTLSVPYHRGYFWHDGRPHLGNLLYAPVPLGHLALLPGPDVTDGRRIRDAAGLCVVSEVNRPLPAGPADDGRATLVVLPRYKRWQLVLADRVRGQGDVPVRAHLAVHTAIAGAPDDPRLASLFATYRQYLREVEDQAVEVLRRAAARSDYATLVASAPALLTDLNAHWRQYVAGGRASFPAALVTTTFSGLVLKPVQEREEVRVQAIVAQVEEAKRFFEKTQDWIKGVKTERWQSIVGILRNLSTKVRDFVGSEVKEDEHRRKVLITYSDTLSALLLHQMRTRANNFERNALGAAELVKLAEQTFKQEQQSLEIATKEVEGLVDALKTELVKLNNPYQQNRKEASP